MLSERRVEALFWLAILALVVAAAAARSQGLGPRTLWHDDVWVAAITRLPLGEALTVPAETPQGMLAVNWIVVRLTSAKELALQALPFGSGLLAIAASALLGRWTTGSRAVGLLLAALAVVNPDLTHYSVFVKQYATEFLLSGVVIALAARELRGTRERIPWSLLVAAILATLFGFGTILVAAAAVTTVFADLAIRAHRTSRPALRILALAAAFDLFVGLYYWVVLRPRSGPDVRNYWRGYFLPTDSLASAWGHLRETSVEAVRAAFPESLAILGWLVPIGIVALLWKRQLRALGLALLAIMAALVAMSALRIYPLGGGRTDIFFFPVVLAAAAAGFEALVRLLPRARAIRIAVAAVAIALVLPSAPGELYYDLDLSDHVRTLNRRSRAAHGIVIYPAANALTAFYTDMPVRASQTEELPYYDFDRPRTLALSRGGAAVDHRQLLQFLAAEEYPRIWLFATRVADENAIEPMVEMIEARGYVERNRWSSRIRTSLILFDLEA